MFKARLMTALVLIPLVFVIIFFANASVFAGVLVLLAMGCGYEWLALIPIRYRGYQVVAIMFLLCALGLALLFAHDVACLGSGMWLLLLPAVLYFPQSQRCWGQPWIVFTLCLVLLGSFVTTSVQIFQQEQGPELITYLLLLVWATDSGAYAVGKLYGQHKCIPKVSPGKTVEGLIGGFAVAMCVALLGYLYFNPFTAVLWFLDAGIVVLMAILGDLFVSMLKRRADLKDTGSIFPGHGGLLDRLDSIIAASPWFYLGLHYYPPGI